ncbi:MAG: universal stress protein [Gammaproteobacteria bacterium]
MFQEIPVFEEDIFAYKVTNKLTEEDYKDFLPKLTTLIHKYGPLSLLLELEDFNGLEAKAAWLDYKFTTSHEKDFKKIAIVGDKRWIHWMTVLASSLTDTNIRYFERKDSSQAWDWLRGCDGKSVEKTTQDNKHKALLNYQHILVATDFSHYSENALQRAQKIARHDNSHLSIVHSIEPLNYYGDSYMLSAIPTYDENYEKQIFESITKQMQLLKKRFNALGANTEILWGTAGSTILNYAEAQNVDLIVMGSHGRRGLAKLIGSTTNGVVNNARCDVLSVSTPKNIGAD